jgi:lipopolysaccharide/colanic/teichoic acid biosynthesis glycosyltransferase
VLFNVLRGEMSLIGGPRPLNLYDAVQLNPEVMTLNVLPRFSNWSSSV